MFECKFSQSNGKKLTEKNLKEKPSIASNISLKDKLFPWISIQEFSVFKKTVDKLDCIFIKNQNSKSEIIIYSPSDFDDYDEKKIGFLIDLSSSLKCNLVTYKYTKSNNISLKSMSSDLMDLISYLQSTYSIRISNLILSGEGIGSYPTLQIAHTLNSGFKTDFKGVIFVSPLCFSKINFDSIKEYFKLKGIFQALVNDIKVFNYNDFIQDVNFPVLLIHGCKDKISSIHEVLTASKKIKRLYYWFPKSGKLNIALKFRIKFLMKINYFLEYVRTSFVSESTQISFSDKSSIENDNSRASI